MPSILFDDYLENFRPIREKQTKEKDTLAISSMKRDSILSVNLDFIKR